MKQIIWFPFVLLAGLLLGSWGPRTEVQRARDEWARTEASLRQTREKADRFENMTRMLRIPSAEPAPPEGGALAPNTEPADALPPPPDDDDAAGDMVKTNPPVPAPSSMKENIQEAIELWKIRSDLARNNFIQRAKLSAEQAVQFDVLVQAMNVRLASQIQQRVDAFKADADAMDAETGVRMIHDLTGAFVLTYDEMDRTLPGWRGDGAEQDFDLIDFVDPSVALPLVEVEDKLPPPSRRRRVRP